MTIRPSTVLRNEYNAISEYCKTKGEPVFITKNGEGDMVLMSIEAFTQREAMLDLREKLLDAEGQYLNAAPTYTVNEVSKRLLERINGKV